VGKKKPKHKWTKKTIVYSVLTVLFVPLPFILFGLSLEDDRQNKLANDSFVTVGTIEKFKYGYKSSYIVYYFFVKNETVYHRTESYPYDVKKKWNLKEGEAFELKVVKSDYSVSEFNFSKPIDTLIDKDKFSVHKYNSWIHRSIIE